MFSCHCNIFLCCPSLPSEPYQITFSLSITVLDRALEIDPSLSYICGWTFPAVSPPPPPPMLSVWNQSGWYKVACVTRWQWFCENSELFDCFVVIKWGVSSSHERDSLFVFLCKAVVHVGANHFRKSPVRDGSMFRLRSCSTNKAKQNKTKQQIQIFQLGLNYPFKWLIIQLKAFMSRPSDCALNNNRNGRL